LGDPAFIKIPTEAFLSPDTGAALRAIIDGGAAAAAKPTNANGRLHTTHFSVVDAKGNAVAMTTTLNNGYGSAVTVTGAGFLLNDQMDDFTTKVGVVNAMGLRQGAANAIEPNKRMLSSMSPTIVLDGAGAPLLITGASGGARIITGVAQVMINVLDYGLPLDAAVAAPRFHAQDYPDSLQFEQGGLSDPLIAALAARGDRPAATAPWSYRFGWVQSILRVGGVWQGVAEPRAHGLALGY
jgi:gamma-glutamyltranspeptidase/glutathione hydrolase